MSAAEQQEPLDWQNVCAASELTESLGIRALIADEQVAIFRVRGTLYAISAIDPFTQAAVLSRGLVGDLQGQVVVASPLYKQHFNLATGQCLEDESVAVKTFPVREVDGQLQVGAR